MMTTVFIGIFFGSLYWDQGMERWVRGCKWGYLMNDSRESWERPFTD